MGLMRPETQGVSQHGNGRGDGESAENGENAENGESVENGRVTIVVASNTDANTKARGIMTDECRLEEQEHGS
jgi:hypothetical protein